MATTLNAGFHNNINTIQLRSSGTSLQRLTDRAIDFDGNGVKEQPAETDPQYSPLPQGIARTIIATKVDTDGGVVHDNQVVSEFTTGVN